MGKEEWDEYIETAFYPGMDKQWKLHRFIAEGPNTSDEAWRQEN